MHLVQLLLPVQDARGSHKDVALFREVTRELVDRFGGLTTYQRAPAKGTWRDDDGQQERDDVVIYEVMVEELDTAWWREYRRSLEERFAQDELVIRAWLIARL